MFFTRRRTIFSKPLLNPDVPTQYDYVIPFSIESYLSYLPEDTCRFGYFEVYISIPDLDIVNKSLLVYDDGREGDDYDSISHPTTNNIPIHFISDVEIPGDTECEISIRLYNSVADGQWDRDVAFYDMTSMGTPDNSIVIHTPSYPSYPKDSQWFGTKSFTTRFDALLESLWIVGSKRYKPQYIGMHFEYIDGQYFMVPNRTYINDGHISDDYISINIKFPYMGAVDYEQGSVGVGVRLRDIVADNRIPVSQLLNYENIGDQINYWDCSYNKQVPQYTKKNGVLTPVEITDTDFSSNESLFIYFNGLGEGLGDSVGGGGYGYDGGYE